MQIVIDIPDGAYEEITNGQFPVQEAYRLVAWIKDGTVLPNEHGHLIQRESAEAIFKNARKALYEQSHKEPIKDFQTREMMLLNAEQLLHLIEPIVETEEKNDD